MRAEYDRLEALAAGPGFAVERGMAWRAIPSDRRTTRDRTAMKSVPAEMRPVVDAVIDTFARFSSIPAYAQVDDRPVVGFVAMQGSTVLGPRETVYVTLRVDPALVHAPDGFARIIAGHAAASAASYVHRPDTDAPSTWPSRSAMARLRKLWATTGDYPAPDGWNYVAATQLRNAYWRAGIDHHALLLSGERLTAEMAVWADAQSHPFDPRYYPSWHSRHLAQQQDEAIFSG